MTSSDGTVAVPDGTLDAATAAAYVALGLDHLEREYPNHPGHLLEGPHDLQQPSALHPVFYGSYDWHSSVHMHWMLLRTLHHHPAEQQAAEVAASFDRRITTANVDTEVAYLDARPWFERPYGWAWLLLLAAELHARRDATSMLSGAWAERTADTLQPLTSRVRSSTLAWLADTSLPQRTGTHGNSAFACNLVWDAATATRDDELRATVEDAASRWYPDDEPSAPWLEPSAHDFLSPTLTLVDLRRRLVEPAAFARWLPDHLGDPAGLLEPVVVPDREDPQVVHLDGLNLSRAWQWTRIGRALPDGHPLQATAVAAARAHAVASLPAVQHASYVGSHWLPTFALLLLDALPRGDASMG
jgi:hypothetical protein